ncbi:hypothetical protein ABG79_00762 [Caloramator mitchellensis]|uniref:Uncharacterized protein n=1 Tax=Caloramator mitchellensis TaxID=908809 RepID=A0A0R3JV32_CALMK|nr:hypothetical protein [Caloramator mitchellensis]KRQ87424.1 hypothetical protein ABG79_00762 [Caloramator mitchellensis]
MDTITAKYELIIYNGGERIELNKINTFEDKVDYSKCSSRISQILLCVLEMKKQLESNQSSSDMDIYTNAINKVAQNLKVNNTTIIDKLTRQLGLSAEQARKIIFDYLRNGSSDFRNLLLKKVSKNTKDYDISAIETTLK